MEAVKTTMGAYEIVMVVITTTVILGLVVYLIGRSFRFFNLKLPIRTTAETPATPPPPRNWRKVFEPLSVLVKTVWGAIALKVSLLYGGILALLWFINREWFAAFY